MSDKKTQTETDAEVIRDIIKQIESTQEALKQLASLVKGTLSS